MGLFDRLSTMLRSNINDLISRAENPEKMLNQLILDMKTQLAKAKQQVASAIADEKKLQSDAEAMKKQAEDWERRAMLAVQEGRDDLAKQALGRYNEQLQGAQQLHETWLKHKAETDAAQALAPPAQRQDRRGQAEEEHPGRAGQAGRSPAADPGDDVRACPTRAPSSRSSGWPRRSRPPSARPSPRPSSTRRSRATRWPSSSRRWSTRAAPISSCWSSRPRWGCWGRARAQPTRQLGTGPGDVHDAELIEEGDEGSTR